MRIGMPLEAEAKPCPPCDDGGTIGHMAAHGKTLDPGQNERVVAAIRRLLDAHEGKQVRLAPLLKIKQPHLSRILSGEGGTSYRIAVRVAELSGLDVQDLLTGGGGSPSPRAAPPDPRYPSRARAELAARLLDCSDEDIRRAIAVHDTADDSGDAYWIGEFLRQRDRRRRRDAGDAVPVSVHRQRRSS